MSSKLTPPCLLVCIRVGQGLGDHRTADVPFARRPDGPVGLAANGPTMLVDVGIILETGGPTGCKPPDPKRTGRPGGPQTAGRPARPAYLGTYLDAEPRGLRGRAPGRDRLRQRLDTDD